MMPAQGSAISDTTHFTGGQVDLLISFHDQRHLQAQMTPLNTHQTTISKIAASRLLVLPWARLSGAGQACSPEAFALLPNCRSCCPAGACPTWAARSTWATWT